MPVTDEDIVRGLLCRYTDNVRPRGDLHRGSVPGRGAASPHGATARFGRLPDVPAVGAADRRAAGNWPRLLMDSFW